jgi:hypothetical protein
MVYSSICFISIIVIIIILVFCFLLSYGNTTNTNQALVISETIQRSFDQPVFVAFKLNNMFVVEESGTIIKVAPDGTSMVWLDLTETVHSHGIEQGLLFLAFEPVGPRFYVTFTNVFNQLVLRRYSDRNRFEDLMIIDNPSLIHNGGWMGLEGDMLFLAIGCLSLNDPLDLANDSTSLAGKILRLDVSGQTGYSSPDTNPYSGDDSKKSEIYLMGFVHPQCTLAADSIWVSDLEKLTQYDKSGKVLLSLSPPGASALISGHIVDHNVYIFGDFVTGCVKGFDLQTSKYMDICQLSSVSSFGKRSDGVLFVCDYKKGTVHQVP